MRPNQLSAKRPLWATPGDAGRQIQRGGRTDKKDETEWMSPGNGIHRMMIVAGARGDFWWFSPPSFLYPRIDR